MPMAGAFAVPPEAVAAMGPEEVESNLRKLGLPKPPAGSKPGAGAAELKAALGRLHAAFSAVSDARAVASDLFAAADSCSACAAALPGRAAEIKADVSSKFGIIIAQ